jgi:hypothetical protein
MKTDEVLYIIRFNEGAEGLLEFSSIIDIA